MTNPNEVTDKEQFIFDADDLRWLWNAVGEPGNFNADFMLTVRRFSQSRSATSDAAGWQPIATAPKRYDVQILTFHADFEPKHGRNKLQKESGYWYQTSFWSEKFGQFVGWPLNIQPTHWMPLPPPVAGGSQ